MFSAIASATRTSPLPAATRHPRDIDEHARPAGDRQQQPLAPRAHRQKQRHMIVDPASELRRECQEQDEAAAPHLPGAARPAPAAAASSSARHADPAPTLCSQASGHCGHISRLASPIAAMLRSAPPIGPRQPERAADRRLGREQAAEERQACRSRQQRRPLARCHGGDQRRRAQHTQRAPGALAMGGGQQADRDPGEQGGGQRIRERGEGQGQQQGGNGIEKRTLSSG